MFLKVSENGDSILIKLPEALFLEGKCTNWKNGKGLFLWMADDGEPYTFNFGEGGHFRCYDLNEGYKGQTGKTTANLIA
ncbi:hypothetical protein [Bacillus sp. V33-4]|uniref:hypothetical protein n=1 Tax=Bacillus sp. V33-4 TaxID=2054169 RepID=UPI000C780A9E|nr:hypothetical protein [Bacillus sp. V33-4]PLR83672.1 hypothetical protein CVD23_13645 [Bacillus sp. V33-4]